MDRSQAATKLLEWQFEGVAGVGGAAGVEGWSLVAMVESLAAEVPARPPSPGPPRPAADFLRLDEEREIAVLLRRLAALGPILTSDERVSLEARLRVGLLPIGRISRIRRDLERFAARRVRKAVQKDFEVQNFQSEKAPGDPLRAVLLFARNGRLLSGEGAASSLDMAPLSQLVSRGEAGSTLSLAHGEGIVVCHIGEHAALVAVFAGRPRASTPGSLRASLQSLEGRGRLVSALHQPSSHDALAAFVRAVRALLQKDA